MNQQATLNHLKLKFLTSIEKLETINMHQYISDEMLFDVRSFSNFSNTQLGTSLFEFVLASLSVYPSQSVERTLFVEDCLKRFLRKSDDYLSTPIVFKEGDKVDEFSTPEGLPVLNKIEFVLWLMCIVRQPCSRILQRNRDSKNTLIDFDKILLYQHCQGKKREITFKNSPYFWNHHHHHTFLSPYCMLGTGDLSANVTGNPYYKKTMAPRRLVRLSANFAADYTIQVLLSLDKKIDKHALMNCIEDASFHDKWHTKLDSKNPWNTLNALHALHRSCLEKQREGNPNVQVDEEVWFEIIQELKKHDTDLYNPHELFEYLNFVLFFYLYINPERGVDLLSKEIKKKIHIHPLIRFYLFFKEPRYPTDRLGDNFVNCLSRDSIIQQKIEEEKLKKWFEDCVKFCLPLKVNQKYLGISLDEVSEEEQQSIIEKALHEKVYSLPRNQKGLYEFELPKIKKEEPKEESTVHIQMIEAEGFIKLKKNVEELKKDTKNDFTNICSLYDRLKEKVPNGEEEGYRKKLATLENVTQEKINFLKEMFPHMSEVTDFIFEQMQLSNIGNKSIQFPPILLNGPAGTGKTFFFKVFSDILQLDLSLMNGPSINAGWSISGLEPSFLGACPGLIYKTLMESNIANPIILLDEMDKIKSSNDRSQPVEDVLLNLFEKHSASQFRDMFVPELKIDASNIIWVCTSNNINSISDPMKSRLKIFEIPMPDRNALKKLGISVYRNLKKSNPWGDFFDQEIPEETLELLVDNDNSVRDMRKCIEFAFARAANEKSTKILPHHLKIQITPEHHLPWHKKLRS